MSHKCFISFKKEDEKFKNRIIAKLGKERIVGKALDRWIDSDNLDDVMQTIRNEYMLGTTVTLFLIGEHSSENEGYDENGEKNAYIQKELQATLYDRKGYPRSGLLGIVLPSMESKIFLGSYCCSQCHQEHNNINISDETVIKEFSENYWLEKNEIGCAYSEDGRFCVLVRYSEFMKNPEKYIEIAFQKLSEPICKKVHWKDLREKVKS